MTEEQTALELFTEQFPVLATDISGLGETIQENLGDEAMNRFDLKHIKLASGGAPGFQTEHGEERATLETFEGLIVHKHKCRSFWLKDGDDDDASSNPDCQSNDGKIGSGDNGSGGVGAHPCNTCPQAVWGTGKGGVGQKCKDQMAVYVYISGDSMLFPSQLLLPPTSLKPFKDYMMFLVQHNVKLTRALHRFETTPDKSAKGKAYVKVKMGFVRELDAEELKPVAQLADVMSGAISQPTPQLSQKSESLASPDDDTIPF